MGDALLHGVVGDVSMLLYVRSTLLSVVQGTLLRVASAVPSLVLRDRTALLCVVVWGRGVLQRDNRVVTKTFQSEDENVNSRIRSC